MLGTLPLFQEMGRLILAATNGYVLVGRFAWHDAAFPVSPCLTSIPQAARPPPVKISPNMTNMTAAVLAPMALYKEISIEFCVIQHLNLERLPILIYRELQKQGNTYPR